MRRGRLAGLTFALAASLSVHQASAQTLALTVSRGLAGVLGAQLVALQTEVERITGGKVRIVVRHGTAPCAPVEDILLATSACFGPEVDLDAVAPIFRLTAADGRLRPALEQQIAKATKGVYLAGLVSPGEFLVSLHGSAIGLESLAKIEVSARHKAPMAQRLGVKVRPTDDVGSAPVDAGRAILAPLALAMQLFKERAAVSVAKAPFGLQPAYLAVADEASWNKLSSAEGKLLRAAFRDFAGDAAMFIAERHDRFLEQAARSERLVGFRNEVYARLLELSDARRHALPFIAEIRHAGTNDGGCQYCQTGCWNGGQKSCSCSVACNDDGCCQ